MTRLTEAEFAALTKRNPDIVVHETIVRRRPAIPVEFEKETITERFERIWGELNGPPLEKEFRFHPPRKWLLDYYHRPTNIAIEIHGGVHSGGRHVRGVGFLRDREKMNAAQLDGIIVIELGTGQVTEDNLKPLIERMK